MPEAEATRLRRQPVQKLNLTNNKALQELNCFNTGLTALNVSQCAKLKQLFCFKTPIETLDLKNCPTLRGYIKNGDFWIEKDLAAGWKATIDDEYTDGLIVSPSTTVTNGKKVLYQGR